MIDSIKFTCLFFYIYYLMKYLIEYKIYESSVVPGSDKSNLLKILNSSKEWYINEDKPEHHQFQYIYDIDENYKIVIVYFTNMNMVYYILDIKDMIYHYVDSVFEGYNKLYKHDSTLDRIINTCKDSMSIFYDREYIPDFNLIKNVIFIELIEDFGFRVNEREMFGFVSNEKLDQYNREDPYFPKDHKSFSNPKLYIVYEQYDSDGTSDSDELINYFENAKERIRLLGYTGNVKCEMFIISTRYYNGKHRPEEIIITMEIK